jgi:WhiB family redox-sensing transcriptional regulator
MTTATTARRELAADTGQRARRREAPAEVARTLQLSLANLPRQIRSVAAMRAIALLTAVPDSDPWGSALCRQSDSEAWFPEQGQSSRPAVRICVRCPLMRPCLRRALIDQEDFGVWGGLTTPQRRSLLKALAARLGDQQLEDSPLLDAALDHFTGPTWTTVTRRHQTHESVMSLPDPNANPNALDAGTGTTNPHKGLTDQ